MVPRPQWLLLLLLLVQPGAQATTFFPQPFPDTVRASEVMVRGTTGESSSDWGPGKRIYTYTELSITEVIKGELTERAIVVREFGGNKDGVGLEVPGTARFKSGEDVVVMLKPKDEKDSSYPLRSLSMGKLNVRRGSDGVETLEGLAVQNDTQRWTLDGLRQLVREQAGHHAVEKTADPAPEGSSASSLQSLPLGTTASQRDPVPDEAGGDQPRQSNIPWIGWFGGLLGLIVLFLFLRRRRF